MAARTRSAKNAKQEEPLPFEASLERLEAIVGELEGGELDLAESLTRFEEGVALSRQCATQLAEARQRIDVLVERNGEAIETPFDEDDVEGSV